MNGMDVHDGSRRLNAKVMAALANGESTFDDRRTGKTITLLTFIAAHIWSWTDSPIVVCDTAREVSFLREMWRVNFGGFPDPRWMSYRQFLRADGISGNVFFDEPQVFWRDEFYERARFCAAKANGFVCGVRS